MRRLVNLSVCLPVCLMEKEAKVCVLVCLSA